MADIVAAVAMPSTAHDHEAAQLPRPARSSEEGKAAVDAEPPEPPPQSWQERAMSFYRSWCSGNTRPPLPDGLEMSPMQYVRGDYRPDGSRGAVAFRDASQTVQFVRLSPANGDEGIVLPDPGTNFVHTTTLVFPSVTMASYSREEFARLEPRAVRRRQGQDWEMT